jgi:transposase InsO family protein
VHAKQPRRRRPGRSAQLRPGQLSRPGGVLDGHLPVRVPGPGPTSPQAAARENGITQRLTRPRSPTTTGKIEQLHQSLQIGLLDDHGPFEDLAALQAALDAWREEYNTNRPHQSLGMAFPATRFGPAVPALEVRVPAVRA